MQYYTSLLLLAVVSTVDAFSTLQVHRRSSALYMNVEQTKTKEMIKVGVIGMGRIGLVHLEAITKAPGKKKKNASEFVHP